LKSNWNWRRLKVLAWWFCIDQPLKMEEVPPRDHLFSHRDGEHMPMRWGTKKEKSTRFQLMYTGETEAGTTSFQQPDWTEWANRSAAIPTCLILSFCG
jgi:hypothetical protein